MWNGLRWGVWRAWGGFFDCLCFFDGDGLGMCGILANFAYMEHPENDSRYTGLTVNSGVVQPPSVNPYLKVHRRKPLPTASELVEGILKGDVTVLSRAVTLVESQAPVHQSLAQEVIENACRIRAIAAVSVLRVCPARASLRL